MDHGEWMGHRKDTGYRHVHHGEDMAHKVDAAHGEDMDHGRTRSTVGRKPLMR